MLDVEVPAGVNPASGRAAGTGAATWTQQNRSVLVAGSFLVAIVLGVVLGLAWASDGDKPSTLSPVAEQPNDPVLSPPLPVVSWNNNRVPGEALRVQLAVPERAALRKPLQWLAAYKVQQETGKATPVATDVSIPDGMYYGAVQGTNQETDVFWAVGKAEIANVPASEVPNPHVWKRVGSAPWSLVDRGPQACASVPANLMTVWGNPNLCAATS